MPYMPYILNHAIHTQSCHTCHTCHTYSITSCHTPHFSCHRHQVRMFHTLLFPTSAFWPREVHIYTIYCSTLESCRKVLIYRERAFAENESDFAESPGACDVLLHLRVSVYVNFLWKIRKLPSSNAAALPLPCTRVPANVSQNESVISQPSKRHVKTD